MTLERSQSCQRVLQRKLVVAAAVTFAVPAVALLGLSAQPSQKSMLHSASGLTGSVAPFAIAAAVAVHGPSLLVVLAVFVFPASVLVSMVIAV